MRADIDYKVGDSYSYRVHDSISNVIQRNYTHTVTRVHGPEVVYNKGGFITDRLGNPTRLSGNRNIVGNQQFPAEFQLGKMWATRFSGYNDNIGRFTIELSMRITARERVTVPAGTFDAFRVEGQGVRHGGQVAQQIRSKTWFAPEHCRRFVLRDERRTGGRGSVALAERQELVSFRQS